MRLYNQPHAFYAGVDLHARTMYTHILDDRGRTVFERDLAACPEAFLSAVQPFRTGLVVGCECMFAWYWLADLCEDHSIPFVLGHALYMKMIHGGKAKNDKIDAGKLAGLLRGGLFPMAYVYPRAKRQTRDLLRRRSFFVRQRAQLIAHIQNTNSQFNLPPFAKKLSYAGNLCGPAYRVVPVTVVGSRVNVHVVAFETNHEVKAFPRDGSTYDMARIEAKRACGSLIHAFVNRVRHAPPGGFVLRYGFPQQAITAKTRVLLPDLSHWVDR